MQHSRNRYKGLHPYASRCIRHQAQKLLRHSALSYQELEDWEQILALSVLEHLPRHDPERASFKTFINHIVSAKVRMILYKEWQLKRRTERFQLMSLPADDDLTNPLFCNSALVVHPDLTSIELRYDLEKALGSLSESLKAVFSALQESPLHHCRQILSRFQIYRGRRCIKEHFLSQGLGSYFSTPSAHFSANRTYKQ